MTRRGSATLAGVTPTVTKEGRVRVLGQQKHALQDRRNDIPPAFRISLRYSVHDVLAEGPADAA